MRLLFIHQNCPGQYKNLLTHLAATGQHEIVFVTQREDWAVEGARKIVYAPTRKVTENIHRYLRTTEAGVLNGQAVWRVAAELKKAGFIPDLMIGHNGWGETLFLKDVFPDTPLLGYFEFFYRPSGSDIGFDPEFMDTADTRLRSQVLNAINLMGLQGTDWGQSPTRWQQEQYPAHYREKISVLHEGIETNLVRPDPHAWLADGPDARFNAGDEIITYVSRNLEPCRGFHTFMRSLPEILGRHPKARAIVVGGDEVSYGTPLPPGETHRQRALAEMGDKVDLSRVHFVGRISYESYLKVLQVSSVHVYLTYPFVISWSMLEAMSAGCLVVGSRTPPVQEFITHGENGLLADFFSPAEFAETINAVLDDPDRANVLRERARQTIVEGYDFKSVCLPRQLSLIEDLVARRPPGAAMKETNKAKGGIRPTRVAGTGLKAGRR